MSLLISITKAPDSVVIAETSKTFDKQGGSIGRGQNNFWVLDDPERFLSSCHCQFSCDNGQFYITDLSTNGTFYNGSSNPIGKGAKLPVNDKDTFTLGDYEFSVSLTGSASLADPFADSNMVSSSAASDDIFSTPPADNNNFAASPFAGGHVSSSESLFNNKEETDPLAALDKARASDSSMNSIDGGPVDLAGSANPFDSPSYSDQADPLNQQISWPDAAVQQPANSGGVIPDDWDEPAMPLTEPLPVAKPAQMPAQPVPAKPQAVLPSTEQLNAAEAEILAEKYRQLKKTNAKIRSQLEMLKQQLNTQQRSAKNDVMADSSLVDAMGFQDRNLPDVEIAHINELAGVVLREMVGGLMQVLGSRSSIKNEFRMNVTTIQPVENNPLKFSANVDDALENMFIKQGNAYKKPVEAVREGFEGIAEHQVAILAGIRAAFKGVVQRFDPVLLEARFSKHNKGSLIPGSQKAKNWELYLDYYNELVGDMDNTFQYLFGDDFVQAYEDQLQKLLIARKSGQTKTDK